MAQCSESWVQAILTPGTVSQDTCARDNVRYRKRVPTPVDREKHGHRLNQLTETLGKFDWLGLSRMSAVVRKNQHACL